MDALAVIQKNLTIQFLATGLPIYNATMVIAQPTTSAGNGNVILPPSSMPGTLPCALIVPAYGPILIVLSLVLTVVASTIIGYYVYMNGVQGTLLKMKTFTFSVRDTVMQSTHFVFSSEFF